MSSSHDFAEGSLRNREGWVMKYFAALVLAVCCTVSQAASAQQSAASKAPATPYRAVSSAGLAFKRADHLFVLTTAHFIQDKNQQKAHAGYLQVTRIDPRFAAAWFNLGVLAEAQKNWTTAELYFRKYLALAPQGPDAPRAKNELALLPQYAAGQVTPAAATQADYDATILRARAFLQLGYYRESIAEAGRAQALG